MQNVLNFPTIPRKLEPLANVIQRFILNLEKQKEKTYQEKRHFLKDECYKVYLKKILAKRKEEKVLDIPEFFYFKRRVILTEAMHKAERAVSYVENLYGRKHIEECYKNRIKKIKKALKK